jgi:hypothetical protein
MPSADRPGTVEASVLLPDGPRPTAEGNSLPVTVRPEPIRDRSVASEQPTHPAEPPAIAEKSATGSGAVMQPKGPLSVPSIPTRPAVPSADHPGTVEAPVSRPVGPRRTAEGKQLSVTAPPEPVRDRSVASEQPRHIERPASPEESAARSGALPQPKGPAAPVPIIRAPRALRPFPLQALSMPLSAALRTLSGGDMGARPPGPAESTPFTAPSEARPEGSVPQPTPADIPSARPSQPAGPGTQTRPADAGVKRNDRVVERQPPEPRSTLEDSPVSRAAREFPPTPNVGTRQPEAAVTVPRIPASPGRRETRVTIGRIDVQVNNRPAPPASAARTRPPGSLAQNVLEARCLNRFGMRP